MSEQKQKNPNDNLDNLAKRLEKELGAKKYFTQFDLRDEKTQQQKSPEIIELEKEMQDKNFSDKSLDQDFNNKNISNKVNNSVKSLRSNEVSKTKQVISNFIKSKKQENQKILNSEISDIKNSEIKSNINNNSIEIKKIFKRTIIYLVLAEIILYIFSLITFISTFLLNILLPLILILDLIVYVWLYIKFFKTFSLPNKKTLFLITQIGIWVGFLRSIFKVIWINQFWTIPNILIETILSGLGAFVVAFIISKIIKNKFQPAPSDF